MPLYFRLPYQYTLGVALGGMDGCVIARISVDFTFWKTAILIIGLLDLIITVTFSCHSI